MNERVAKWEERYANGDGFHEFRASDPLPLAASLVAPGRALDLAAGAGRHAIYLAERGWRVVALEGARAGLDAMVAEARRRGVADRIDARVVDLERRPLELGAEDGSFGIVCLFYFLERALFDDVRRLVRPGGVFAAAIHTDDPSGSTAGHGFMLAPDELRATVAAWDWEIVHSYEGASRDAGHRHATAELVARRPA